MEMKKPIKFIKDNPADEDIFGGYHENIADGLLDVITNNPQSLSIAICGERGSGKSTIQNLLKKKSTKNTIYLEYDAWIHQHDQPRRSFLLSLYGDSQKYLKELNCFNFQFANLKKGKKFEKPSSHIEYLFGAFALAYLVTVYFFQEEVSKYLIENHIRKNEPELAWLVTNIVIILLPVLIYAFKPARESVFSKISSVFGFTYTETASNKIDIEHADFAKYFTCLCFQLERIGFRPVIMVDNLDRIGNHHREDTILTQIKSIFECSFSQDENLLSPILIVAITPEWIQRAFIRDDPNKVVIEKNKFIPPFIDPEKNFDIVLTSIKLEVIQNNIKSFFADLLTKHILNIFPEIILDKEDTYTAFQSKNSSYGNTPRGCKKYINDMIFELTLLEDLIGGIETGEFIVGNQDIWRVFAMYIAIRNYSNVDELKRISSWGDNFERAIKEAYPSTSFSTLPLLQDMYNRFEARARDTYPISKRNIEPQLNGALYNLLSENKDNKLDEYTIRFYKRIHRQDHLVRLILENLQNNRFNSQIQSDLYLYFEFYDYMESILRDAQNSVGFGNTMKADIDDISMYLKTNLKNEVSIFKPRRFTDYDKIFSFIHDTLQEKFTPIMIDDHLDQNHMNFYHPPSLYHVYIWGVIARLIQTDIEGLHPHESVFYNCLISNFSKHPEFFNLFKILSSGYVKDNDLRNIQLHIRNHFPVTDRIDSMNDMVSHYHAALEKIVIHEKESSMDNKSNFFQDVLNYIDK